MINKIINRETILYLIFGGLTTLVNIVVFFIFDDLLNINTYISNFIAWITSVLFAFITNKTIVFNSNGKALKEMFLFFFYRILSLGFDMLTMFILIDFLDVNNLVSKIIANIIVVILNYVFSKLFIFKK